MRSISTEPSRRQGGASYGFGERRFGAARPVRPHHRMRLRKLLGDAALVLVAGIVAVAPCEIAARLIYPPLRGAHWYHQDPRYGLRHLANLDETVNEWGDGDYWRFRT